MSVKKIDAHQNNLTKSQKGFVATKMIDAFSAHPIYKKIGANQQALSLEAIIFHFKNSPFTYEIDTEITQNEITKEKFVKETCHFKIEITIPATSHILELQTEVKKNTLDVK